MWDNDIGNEEYEAIVQRNVGVGHDVLIRFGIGLFPASILAWSGA